MNHPQTPRILFEDNHCLALDKPAGWLSQGDATGAVSMVDWARDDLKTRYSKPGNVFVGLVHRLDRPVSGVLLLAKTSKSASRLSEQFREGEIEKVYLAVVEGRPSAQAGAWEDYLRKDEARNLVEVVSAVTPGGKLACLEYRALGSIGGSTILELRPRTGRGHQLRVQLASRGLPILGDRKYGAKTALRALDGGFRIALHAKSLGFKHPTKPEVIEVLCEVPADWPCSDGREGPSDRGTQAERRLRS